MVRMLGKGRTIEQYRVEAPRLERVSIAWGESFMRPKLFTSLVLRRE